MTMFIASSIRQLIKNKRMKLINKFRVFLLIMPFVTVHGQTTSKLAGDSVSLSEIINKVISNYPAIKKAEQEIEMANAKIGLTKTAYLPDINFASSYSRIGPVTSINFGGKVLQLFPENVYNATVSLNENIYDFGKTLKSVAFDEKNKALTELSVEQSKQRLSMALMSNYYTISFLQEAILIKDEQLKTLNLHLDYVQKKAATGSAIQYDILTTKVRISTLANQKTDLQTALQIQIGQLNSFLGKSPENPVLLKKEIQSKQLIPSLDSLVNKAFSNRNELKLALKKEELSKSRIEVIQVQNNPALNAFASGGFKNGYLNDSFQDVGKFNFAVGVGLKVPIFDANRSKFLKIQANAELEGMKHESELIRRNITNEVLECKANSEAALKKVNQSELQLQQAEQAYNLAEVSYKTGTITHLDLLDSYAALTESKLTLYKTKIDYSANLQRLKIAMGEKIY